MDEARRPSVVFLFPGQGGQHVGMARDLYRHQPAFASAIDECAELASVPFGLDLRTVLYPTGDPERASQQLATMALGQVTVFVVEYALVQLLGAWGGAACVVLGHSLGAYAAACTAGVFSLPDALRLVMERGRLLDRLAEAPCWPFACPNRRSASTLVRIDPGLLARNDPPILWCRVAALVMALILLVRFAVGGRWRAPTRRCRRSLAHANKQRTRAKHQRSTTNTTATILATARSSPSPSPSNTRTPLAPGDHDKDSRRHWTTPPLLRTAIEAGS